MNVKSAIIRKQARLPKVILLISDVFVTQWHPFHLNDNLTVTCALLNRCKCKGQIERHMYMFGQLINVSIFLSSVETVEKKRRESWKKIWYDGYPLRSLSLDMTPISLIEFLSTYVGIDVRIHSHPIGMTSSYLWGDDIGVCVHHIDICLNWDDC